MSTENLERAAAVFKSFADGVQPEDVQPITDLFDINTGNPLIDRLLRDELKGRITMRLETSFDEPHEQMRALGISEILAGAAKIERAGDRGTAGGRRSYESHQ